MHVLNLKKDKAEAFFIRVVYDCLIDQIKRNRQRQGCDTEVNMITKEHVSRKALACFKDFWEICEMEETQHG